MISNSLTKYQALVLEGPEVMRKACQNLNSSTCLPEGYGKPLHSCEEVLLVDS